MVQTTNSAVQCLLFVAWVGVFALPVAAAPDYPAPTEAGQQAAVDLASGVQPAVGRYFVRLAPAPVAQSHPQALREQIQATRNRAQVKATTTAANQNLAGLTAQRNLIHQAQEAVLADLQHTKNSGIGARRSVRRYDTVFSGLALSLDPAEIARLRSHPDVTGIFAVQTEQLLTDAGPQWINAPAVWNGAGGAPDNRGEGVVVGVIDSGINPSHPSFADTGISNPRGQFFGNCQGGGGSCNDKLIGIYDFTDEGNIDGEDRTSHGTHVASIAVGNAVSANINANTTTINLPISGVAPRANLISYKACVNNEEGNGSCAGDATLAAIEQAIIDGVDVINYSIGGLPTASDSPWNPDRAPQDEAFLNANSAGIFVAIAAGNEGPGPDTITRPAYVPWAMALGNATHNRTFANRLINFTGGASSLDDLTGAGLTAGYGPAPIVHASDFGNALCGEGGEIDFPPSGASNPFAPGTFDGEIVVCDRGTYARVAKSFNVMQAGAGGFVLANTDAESESIVSDDHFVPGTHIGAVAGDQLRSWLASGSGHMATIGGFETVLDDADGDQMAVSSSRGLARNVPGLMKPEAIAPGSGILAANAPNDANPGDYGFKTGTSMASPHAAGAAALILSAHPDWTPDEVRAALMLTAIPDQAVKQDGTTPADVLDRGAGRIDVAAAVNAGLGLRETRTNYLAADPASGGNPASLNMPSIYLENCEEACSASRTLTALVDGTSWQVFLESENPGLVASISPASFSLPSRGDTQALTISFDTTDARVLGQLVDARIVLEKTAGPEHVVDAALPAAVSVPAPLLPQRWNIATPDNHGHQFFDLAVPTSTDDFRVEGHGLVQASEADFSLRDDGENDPYALSASSDFVLTEVGPDQIMLIARQIRSTSTDFDLYVGLDRGDGVPESVEELCSSTSIIGLEQCQLQAPAPGTYWIMLHNDGSFNPDQNSPADLAFASVPRHGPGLIASASSQIQSDDDVTSVRVAWNQGAMKADEIWYGAVSLGVGDAFAEGLGLIPVVLEREDSDGLEAEVLTPGQSRIITLAAGETHTNLFFHLPPNLPSVSISMQGEGDVDLYLSPGSAQLDPGAAAVSATAGTSTESVSVPSPQSGQWFAGLINGGSNAATVELLLEVPSDQPATATHRGYWFNPARDNHGLDINSNGAADSLLWYTYDEQGLPTWYIAAGPRDGNIWFASLLRSVWNGTKNATAEVGRMVVTYLGPDQAVYSWELFGVTGSETMQPIGNGLACPDAGVNYSGTWFEPSLSGYGGSILTSQPTEVITLYIYDDFGEPRWLQGDRGDFGSGNSLDLTAFTDGFCPTCPRLADPTTQSAGNMMRQYDSATSGNWTINADFPMPLLGNWNTDGPIAPLTSPQQCPQ